MVTQIKLDEMRVKAEQNAQRVTEEWYKTFLGPRHPDNMPDQMMRQPEQPQQPMTGGPNG